MYFKREHQREHQREVYRLNRYCVFRGLACDQLDSVYAGYSYTLSLLLFAELCTVF